jgi:hypothetical protein
MVIHLFVPTMLIPMVLAVASWVCAWFLIDRIAHGLSHE